MTQNVDWDAIASKHGATITDQPPPGPVTEWDAVPKKYMTASPKKSTEPDWDALAKKYGATITDQPSTSPAVPPGFEIEPEEASAAGPQIPAGFEIEAQASQEPPALKAPSAYEDIGRQMQRSALAKIPHELRGYTPAELAAPSGQFNYRTGRQYTVGEQLARGPILDAPVTGTQQIIRGVERMAELGYRAKAGGALQVLGGAMETATPLLAASALTAPLTTAAGVGTGMLAQRSTEAALEKAGVPEEYRSLAGNVAGLAAGGIAAHAAGRPAAQRAAALTPENVTPVRPSQVDRVSPSTPNPPTAALPTTPESPETISLQVQQLGVGTRRVVMFPAGTAQPDTYPPGVSLTHDKFGNTYAYRPDLIRTSEIHKAARENRLPEILGSAESGLGAKDKSALPPHAPVVTVHGPDGTEIQSTATAPEDVPTTVAASQEITPQGGTITVQPAENVLAQRLRQPAEQLGAPQPIEEASPAHATSGSVRTAPSGPGPSPPETGASPSVPTDLGTPAAIPEPPPSEGAYRVPGAPEGGVGTATPTQSGFSPPTGGSPFVPGSPLPQGAGHPPTGGDLRLPTRRVPYEDLWRTPREEAIGTPVPVVDVKDAVFDPEGFARSEAYRRLWSEHVIAVEDALDAGKPVPEAVLKDLPEPVRKFFAYQRRAADLGSPQPVESDSPLLASGLGGLQTPFEKFVAQDITPAAKGVSQTISGALDDIRKVFAPQTRGPAASKAAGLIRETGSELDQRRDRAVAALQAFGDHFYRDTPQEHGVYGLPVIDAIESGKTEGLFPTDRAFAEKARELLDQRKDEVLQLGLLKSYVENYFPHEYKDPEAATRWVQSWQTRRPLAGTEAYRKQRTYPTLREALGDPDFRMEAKFDNPVDFVLSKLAQMDKSITAHRAFNELDEQGWLQYIPAGGKVPVGAAPIDDRIFTVFGPKYGAVKIEDLGAPEGLEENVRVLGRREMGRYYAAEPLARVINNYLSPGLESTNVYKAWRAVNNTLNMIDLGASWYHGLTTTLNSSLSDMALGLKEALAGRPVKAVLSVARGFSPFASAIHDVYKGTEIQKIWDGKVTNPEPVTDAIVGALKRGGGRARQDEFYATKFTDDLLKAWQTGNLPGALWRAPFSALEQTMRPIMEYLVPRAKLGAFAKRAQMELEANPTMGTNEARETFGRIWDSIDNRFGQLSQRNLLMHNMARNLMNAVVGRPGWNIGTVREIGGGLTDAMKNMADVARGRKTEISDRTAYTVALLLGGATMNGLINYALSGSLPHGSDFLAPRDGGVTEDGRPSRIILPLYLSKDIYSYATRPRQTLKAKAAPAATILADLLSNEDFQGHKIVGRGGIGLGHYLLSAVTPYSVQGLQRNLERGAPVTKTLLPFAGIMPAGRRVGLSKAEQIITDYLEEQRPAVRPAPTAHTRARAQVFQAARSGDFAKARQIGMRAVRGGALTEQDVGQIIQRARQSPLVSDFKRLPVNVALQVYDAATADERRQLRPFARQRVLAARGKPYEWDEDSIALAQKYFGIRIPRDLYRPSPLSDSMPMAMQ
jgi:hypothetical protein